MAQPVSMFACLTALIAVVIASRAFGRTAGMLAAATCGASVAYVMPPAFSFQVDSLFDQAILALYGAFSLLVLARSPGKSSKPAWRVEVSDAPAEQPGTHVSQLVRRMLPPGAPVLIGDFIVNAPPARVETALREVLDGALSHPSTLRISVYGGRWPGVDRIWVAAQYLELPDDASFLAAQKDCKSAPLASGTWFDNGYERVYQISIPIPAR